MNKVLCNKNHYYDADKFSACPHCARAKAFLERTAQTAQHAAPPAQDGPAKGGYWSLDDLRGKTSLPDTPVAGFSAPPPVQAGDAPAGYYAHHAAVPAGRDAAVGSACACAGAADGLPKLRCADG